MAMLQVNFMSEALMRTVTVNVVLPVDKLTAPGAPQPQPRPFKTLYLLNGVLGNYTDWANATCIQTLAEALDLAVVMPSGENLFYLDYPAIHALHGEFVGRELVELTRRMFPLSSRREDTFLGGLSMGGYGALRNGLKYADTFGAIVAFSTAMELYDLERRTNDPPMFFERRDYAQFIFGDFDKVRESDKNPVWLARQCIKEKRPLPEVYMAVGTEDFLLANNRRLRDELRREGLRVTYEEAPGGHEWGFWGRQLSRALDWLPLQAGAEGLNSGHVGL